MEGRIYYRGPRRPGGDLPRIKVDLTADEVLIHDPVHREVTHPYSDGLPGPPRIACYSLPEIFGEKLGALAERCLPRDLYDVINIFRRPGARGSPEVRSVMVDPQDGEVFVEYDGQTVKPRDLVAALEAAGFKARQGSP